MPLLIFLDTETTGLDETRHTPWEVAWRVYEHTDGALTPVTEMRTYLVDLTKAEYDAADPVALDIGRFWTRYDNRADNFADRALIEAYLRQDVSEHLPPVLLAGACPWFDDTMLARWWGGTSHRPWHYHLVDVENLAAGKLGRRPPWKYDEILATFGIKVDEATRHTAAGDVAVTVDLYARVFGL